MVAAFLLCWWSLRWILDLGVVCWLTRFTAGVSHGALDAGIPTTVAPDSNCRGPDLHQVHVDCVLITGDIGGLQVVARADIVGVSKSEPVCLLERLGNRCGVAGARFASGTADGQKVLQEYMVIWVSLYRDLMHMMQTYPAVVGFARIAVRRGLGVSSDKAQDEHKVLRPDTLFLPQGDLVTYIVGPFPFGIDRQGIGKAMSQANWQCLPLVQGWWSKL